MGDSQAIFAMCWSEWIEFSLLRNSHIEPLELANSAWSTKSVLDIAEECGFELAEGAINTLVTRGEINRPPTVGGRRTWFASEIEALLKKLVEHDWKLTSLAATCAHYKVSVLDYWKGLHAAAEATEGMLDHKVRPNPNFFDATFAHAWNGFPQRVSFSLRPEYIQLHSEPESAQ